MDSYTDKYLFNAVRDRNNKVLQYIYKSYLPLISNYISNNQGDKEEAQDVFQEAIILIYRKLKANEIQTTGSFKSYLFSVAKFLWYKRLRAGNTRKKYENEMKITSNILNEISETYKTNQKYKLFQKHYQGLGKLCKEILQLYMQKYSNEKIAQMLGNKSPEYIKTKKYKCKEILVKKIKNDPEYKDLYLDDFLEI